MGSRTLLLVLLGVLSGSLTWGAQFPDKAQVKSVADFSYGLYDSKDPSKIPDNASPNMRNVLVDESFTSVFKRGGQSVAGSTSNAAYFSRAWDLGKNDGSVTHLLFGSTSATPSSTSGILVETSDFVTWTMVRSGLSGVVDLDSAQVQFERWFTNGTDSVFVYNGTTVSVMNGAGGTPNVPKGRLITYNENRVYIGNLSDDSSAVAFSVLNDTTPSANVVAPNQRAAWPDGNFYRLSFDRGDGEELSFLGSLHGIVCAGKASSMFIMSGTSELNFRYRRTDARAGFISQVGVSELDGVLYGQGRDGFYAFDLSNMVRISDPISNRISAIRSETTRIIDFTWETQADFKRGSFYGTTSTVSGLLTIATIPVSLNFTGEVSVPTGTLFTFSGSTFTPWGVLKSSITLDPFLRYTLSTTAANTFSIKIWSGDGVAPFPAAATVVMHVRNSNTGSQTFSPIGPMNSGQFKSSLNDALSNRFLGSDVNGGAFQVKFECVTDGFQIYVPTEPGNAEFSFAPVPLDGASYMSEISTGLALTSWGNFNSVATQSSGTVSYFYRTSTSAVAIATQAWIGIVAGPNIGAPASQNYIQWASSISFPRTAPQTTVDNVVIDYISGGASLTRSFSAVYNNRLWLGVSTEATGNYPIIYVKARNSNSNPLAWMPFENINVRGLLFSQGTFYGVGASSGAVYIQDTGYNDFGSPVDAMIETPELDFGDTTLMKRIFEYGLDLESQANSTLTLGVSFDREATTDFMVSLSGSGRYTTPLKKVHPRGRAYAKTVKLRFRNTDLGLPFQLNGYRIYYVPTQIR